MGNGTAAMARDFRDTEGVTAPLFTDPGRRTYEAIGAARGMLTVVDPRAALATARALAAGHRQSATAGTADQQGGELVVTPGSEVTYLHLARFAGDHAEVAEVVAAIP